MLKVLIVEDEELIRKGIALTVDWAALDCVVVGEAANGVEGLEKAEKCDPDLIITDLKMPQMDGIEMLERLRQAGKTTHVIILTAYDSFSYVQTALRLEAVDYLLKPFAFDDFTRAAMKVKRLFELEHRAVMQGDDDVVFFKTEHRVVKVKVADISYVEGMGEYLKIYVGDNKPLVVLLSMKRIEERLPSWFMRIHRSYIVNLHKINEVNKNRVILDADTFLPIGDSYRENFMSYLNTRFMG